MEKLPAVPSETLTLSKNMVPQVPSYNLPAIPSDCQGPVQTNLLSLPEQLAQTLGCLLPWNQVQYQGGCSPADAGMLQWESLQSLPSTVAP